MITLLKLSQLTIALAVNVLFIIIYPGIMMFISVAVGIIYILVSIGAILENRLAIWAAFMFSAFTAVLSTMGVNQFLSNGFDFFTGTFEQTSNLQFTPYIFLAISIGAALVVVAHLVCWQWLVPIQLKETK